MTNASSSNRRHSDTALLTEPHKQRHYDTNDERAFLAQQAADAKTAMQHTIADMQTAAKEVANVPLVDAAIPLVCGGRSGSAWICCHDLCPGAPRPPYAASATSREPGGSTPILEGITVRARAQYADECGYGRTAPRWPAIRADAGYPG